jgi:hypothetical protein
MVTLDPAASIALYPIAQRRAPGRQTDGMGRHRSCKTEERLFDSSAVVDDADLQRMPGHSKVAGEPEDQQH